MKFYKLYMNITQKASYLFDKISQLILGGVVLLVVVNILLRVIFRSPIFGTYEYVGFLTSLVVGLALAKCAFQDGHIAVEYVANKLPQRFHVAAELVMGVISFVFFILVTWHIGLYAYSMVLSGELSAATRTPIYVFIFVVAFGVFTLCLVILSKIMESLRQVLKT